jgi:MFS family permease
MFNGARLFGPAVGGLMIARLGEGACFLIDAISYLAVLAALLAMKLRKPETTIPRKNALRELREGFRYAIGFAPVRTLLLLCAFISGTVGVYQTLMPMFAKLGRTPEQGAAVFGFLGAAVGVGALGGAIYLASRRSVVGLGRVIAFCAGLAGVAIAVFAMTPSLPVLLLTSTVAGFGMIITFAASNTLLQTIVEDEMRGRLMSFFILAVMGTAPLGSLAGGWIANRIGEPRTVLFCGIASIIAAVLFMLSLPSMRSMVRPIYVKRGIIPEFATGLAAAQHIDTQDST